MTKKEIIKALLAHYTTVITKAKELSYKQQMELIWINSIQNGICFCSYDLFGVNIYKARWVARFIKKKDRYWGQMPRNAANSGEFIEALQVRIDNLTKLMSEYKKP